jgi:hypothetical protein
MSEGIKVSASWDPKYLLEDSPNFAVIGGGPSKEIFRITPTETGFDVVIPEGITLTEAAQTFIDAVNDLLSKRHKAA